MLIPPIPTLSTTTKSNEIHVSGSYTFLKHTYSLDFFEARFFDLLPSEK